MRPRRSPPSPSRRSTSAAGLPYFLRRPGGMFGAVWLVLLIVASFTAPLWRPYEVADQDLANRLALPSGAHWLGTDALGRDLFSRIVTAARRAAAGLAGDARWWPSASACRWR